MYKNHTYQNFFRRGEGKMLLRNKISILTLTAFLVIMSVSAAAQTPPDLEISDPQFVWNVNSKFVIRTANSTSSELTPLTMEMVQEISALFRNTGTKTIKRVSWQYIGYEDVARTKIWFAYTSRNKTTILPGDEVRLNKLGSYTGRARAVEAKIFRIEYADGTIWEGEKTKN